MSIFILMTEQIIKTASSHNLIGRPANHTLSGIIPIQNIAFTIGNIDTIIHEIQNLRGREIYQFVFIHRAFSIY